MDTKAKRHLLLNIEVKSVQCVAVCVLYNKRESADAAILVSISLINHKKAGRGMNTGMVHSMLMVI